MQISLLETAEKGVLNRGLSAWISRFEVRYNGLISDGELGENENHARLWMACDEVLRGRSELQFDLKLFYSNNRPPHPLIPRSYFLHFLAQAKSLISHHYGHLELLAHESPKKKGGNSDESRETRDPKTGKKKQKDPKDQKQSEQLD